MIKYIILALILFPLFAHAQDTSYITYRIPINVTDTVTIPLQSIFVKDTVIIVSDTSYPAYYRNKTYATLHAMLSFSFPIYDTIAAHDSIFVCVGCGWKDTTVQIITPTSAIQGVFVATSGSTPIAQRITTAKGLGCTSIRYNYDLYNVYSNKQFLDSGMIVITHINNLPVQQKAPFPLDLTRYKKSIDSLFKISKPSLFACENEEANINYHSGSAIDYVNELNASIEVAHNNSVKVTNGGITPSIVYYIRNYYQVNGLADSVAWINHAFGLGPNVSPYAQSFIDWYSIEIQALAASNIDYVNFHWYEPHNVDNNNAIDTTSGVIPVMINFLAKYTGKPIACTEWGTYNSSTTLLYATGNEIKNTMHAGYQVYYLGNGSGPAFGNPDGFKAWLLQ